MDSLPNYATFVDHPRGDAEGADALRTSRLSNTFGPTIAVDHIDVAVPPGAFLGLDVSDDPVRAKTLVGALPDGLSVPERLIGGEVLTYTGRPRGMPTGTVAERAGQLLHVLELGQLDDLRSVYRRRSPRHPVEARRRRVWSR